MADEDEFNFDLNEACNLDDIQLDESELAEFGLTGSAGSGDMMKELQAMADSSTKSPAVHGNFGFIRAMDTGDADYNVDNVVLTPEDMEDPSLLAELGQLNDNINMRQTVPEQEGELPLELKLECEDRATLEKYIAEEKKMALTSKRAGDMEGAGECLKAMKALQARLNELSASDVPVEFKPLEKPTALESNDKVAVLKAQALEAKRMGDITLARELLSQAKQLDNGGAASPVTAHAPSPASKAKAKEAMSQLTKQIEQCLEAAKVYLKRNSQADAGLLVNRKKAFEADLMSIKAAVLGNKTVPEGRTVSVELPIDLENVEVADDELKVVISALEPSNVNPRKSKDNLDLFASKSDHFFQVTFAYSAEDTSHHEKSSPIFKMSSFPGERIQFTGLKRDVKLTKFFEHQKVRIDLFKKESSFFRSKNVLIGSAHAKLNGLMTAPTVEMKGTELLDGSRRSIGMQIDLALKLRRPISNKIAATRTVNWTVFDEAPLTSGRLFSDPNKPLTIASPPSTAGSSSDDPEASDVSEIESYAVVEHELDLLATNPATMTDPNLTNRQLELESKKDSMEMAFQIGQVSFEDYLEALKAYIDKTKKRALDAKRAGAIDKARYYMKHVQIVEKEIADAAAAGDDVEE